MCNISLLSYVNIAIFVVVYQCSFLTATLPWCDMAETCCMSSLLFEFLCISVFKQNICFSQSLLTLTRSHANYVYDTKWHLERAECLDKLTWVWCWDNKVCLRTLAYCHVSTWTSAVSVCSTVVDGETHMRIDTCSSPTSVDHHGVAIGIILFSKQCKMNEYKV